MTYQSFRNWFAVFVTLAVLILPIFAAAQTQIQGVIDGRSGPSMTVKTADSGNVTVLLSDNTQVIEPEGVFRKKHLALTALIPGLQVKVKGSYNRQNMGETAVSGTAPAVANAVFAATGKRVRRLPIDPALLAGSKA